MFPSRRVLVWMDRSGIYRYSPLLPFSGKSAWQRARIRQLGGKLLYAISFKRKAA
jgi:hypothetical protein